jgi:hypothetical protein
VSESSVVVVFDLSDLTAQRKGLVPVEVHDRGRVARAAEHDRVSAKPGRDPRDGIVGRLDCEIELMV